MSKFIPQIKEKKVKAKIKPPAKRVVKYKITPEVRKAIQKMADWLPETPFLKKQGDSLSFQRIKTSRLMTDKEKEAEHEKTGEKFDMNRAYIQHGQKLHLMNHKVILTAGYEEIGPNVFDVYKEEVDFIQSLIAPPKEEINNETTIENDTSGK